jgi:hypothetical protein
MNLSAIITHALCKKNSLLFTKLPRELRDLIYLELFGGRHVHIEYDFQRPNIFLYPSDNDDDTKGKKRSRDHRFTGSGSTSPVKGAMTGR